MEQEHGRFFIFAFLTNTLGTVTDVEISGLFPSV